MNDFERHLQDALKDATSDYRPGDPHEAKQRFMGRLRRRRIALVGGSVALAAAAVAVGVMVLPGELTDRAADTKPLPPATQLEPHELSVIPVGEAPSGIGYGNGMAWVANTDDGTIQVIDPLTNSIVETHGIGGSPDDVAVGLGAAWASDSSAGVVTKLPFLEADGPDIHVGEPGHHLDVAPGSGAVWVVSEDDSLYRIDPVTNEVRAVDTGLDRVSDVAAGQDTVIVLGGTSLTEVDPISLEATPIATVEASDNQDLQMSEGAVWVANGDAGVVTRFDLESGERSDPVYLGGNFTAIASGEGSMWMVSGDEGADGRLTRIDPVTTNIVGARVSLGGRPYDITTGAGSIWVVNHSGNSVSRIDPNELPEKDETPREMGRPLFAFSADGDIFIEDVDGQLTQVTESGADELFPSLSPDANSVVFQRGETPDGEIVLLNLLDGKSTTLGRGEWPSFGPDGRVAYSVDNQSGAIEIVRPGLDETVRISVNVDGPSAPFRVASITWDLTGEYLYYLGGWEGYGLFQVDADGGADPFEIHPGDSPLGAVLSAPFVRGRDSVNVLQACCYLRKDGRDHPYESVELGLIRFTEGGPQYRMVEGLDAKRFPPGAIAIGQASLAAIGHYELAGGS
ncbi:MAG: hypothetical protein QOG16_1167, partial [Actinomycetota bacterium]|nr:hypothetical protein [Actinomycetota bacterium]